MKHYILTLSSIKCLHIKSKKKKKGKKKRPGRFLKYVNKIHITYYIKGPVWCKVYTLYLKE